LDRLTHAIEQAAEVGRAVRQALGGEERARVVERTVDLAAGRKPELRGIEKTIGLLQRQEVGAHRSA
jgi:hypothetical protein